METRNLCSLCAQSGKTCCQETEVYLTLEDIRRIISHTGQPDFYEYRTPLDPSYLDQDEDPLWAARTIRSDGSRRVLKHNVQRDCHFLSPTGCILPMDVRPLVCRLHPYSYTEKGIGATIDQRCRRTPLGAEPDLPLGMSEELAGKWHHQLYQEILNTEGEHHHENRPDL